LIWIALFGKKGNLIKKMIWLKYPRWFFAYYVSRIADLEKDVQKLCNEKNMLVLKFEEASREPGAVFTMQHA